MYGHSKCFVNVHGYTYVCLEFDLYSSGDHLGQLFENLPLHLLGHHIQCRWIWIVAAVQNLWGSVVVRCCKEMECELWNFICHQSY